MSNLKNVLVVIAGEQFPIPFDPVEGLKIYSLIVLHKDYFEIYKKGLKSNRMTYDYLASVSREQMSYKYQKVKVISRKERWFLKEVLLKLKTLYPELDERVYWVSVFAHVDFTKYKDSDGALAFKSLDDIYLKSLEDRPHYKHIHSYIKGKSFLYDMVKMSLDKRYYPSLATPQLLEKLTSVGSWRWYLCIVSKRLYVIGEDEEYERRCLFILKSFLAGNKGYCNYSNLKISQTLNNIWDYLDHNPIPERGQVPKFSNLLKRVEEWEREISRQKLAKAIAENDRKLSLKYPDPWIKPSGRIEYIDNFTRLSQEGIEQEHCVGTYHTACEKGICQIYSITDGVTRITFDVRNIGGKYYITQAMGFRNRSYRSELMGQVRVSTPEIKSLIEEILNWVGGKDFLKVSH